MIDKENTTIVNGAGKKADIGARVAQIRRRSRKPPRTTTVKRERLAKLAGSVAVIRVGGATESR